MAEAEDDYDIGDDDIFNENELIEEEDGEGTGEGDENNKEAVVESGEPWSHRPDAHPV